MVQMQSGFRSIEPEVSTSNITCGRMFRISGPWAEAVLPTESKATSKEATKIGSESLIVPP